MSVNVVLAIGELEIGGTQRQMLELAANLDKKKFCPRVICLSNSLAFAEEFKKAGVPVDIFTRSSRYDARLLSRLGRYFKAQQVQVLMSFGFTADLWCRVAAWMAQVPVVISSVRTSSEEARSIDFVNRTLRAITDHFVANSDAVARYLLRIGVPKGRYTKISNGLDLGKADACRVSREQALATMGLPSSSFVIGIVSRLSREKNVAGFLQLAKLTSGLGENVRFVVIGDGPEANHLHVSSSEMGIGDRITWLGARSDVLSLIHGFDVAVLTSKREGLSNTLLEYMAAARAIIASNVGGNPELIDDGETGFLYSLDEPGQAVDCIGRLYVDENLRNQLGSLGRARVESRFSTSILVKRTQDLMATLLAAKAPTASMKMRSEEIQSDHSSPAGASRRIG
jgi:glycosyltransferase involved in cell wall biosynthesis